MLTKILFEKLNFLLIITDGVAKSNEKGNTNATNSAQQQQSQQPTIVKASKDKKKINQKVCELYDEIEIFTFYSNYL